MPAALFLSAHLDDVAFSCGGTFRALATSGWDTTLCTIFTRSVAARAGFALACQVDKGLGPEIDYLAIRRAEDHAAAFALGANRVVHLDLAEAPHRGYTSAPALFGPFVAADDVAPEIDALIERRLVDYDLIFAPQALGHHVDHRRVRDAVLGATRVRELRERVVWYRDAPYVLREPHAHPEDRTLTASARTFAFELDEAALAAKLDACAAYRSQLGFQFGGEASMREALRSFALAEGSRFDIAGAAEVFRGASVDQFRDVRNIAPYDTRFSSPS